VRDAYFGPVLFVLSTPKSIFIPVFLVIFGIDHTATAFGTFEAFFYVTVNVVGGVDLVEQRHLTMARAFRAGPWHTFRDVLLPASLPGVFAGIWYGIKHAFLAVVIVELYMSAGGLGQVIRQYTNQLETDKVLAMILGVSIIAIAVGVAWTHLEHRLARWRGDDRVTTTTVP
jgi:ABC-type nitrate/sulfonate/bicarbonate transport system permease component